MRPGPVLTTLDCGGRWRWLQGTYGGVFAQLAERREGLLVSLADFVDQLLQLAAQLVALGQHHLLLHVLLLLVPVVAHR